MRFCLILFSAFLLVILPRMAAAGPLLAFEEQATSVSGVTPNGRVVWFSVAKEVEGYMAHFVRREEILADTDGDGVVRFELDQPVPLQSIWVAVDLATGEAVVATPEGYPLREAGSGPGRGRGEPDRPEWVEEGREILEILVVRPGQGAWGLTVGDGGAEDGDGRGDGRSTASLARMRSLDAGAGPLERFHPKDLVFAIDLDRMEILSERIPAFRQP